MLAGWQIQAVVSLTDGKVTRVDPVDPATSGAEIINVIEPPTDMSPPPRVDDEARKTGTCISFYVFCFRSISGSLLKRGFQYFLSILDDDVEELPSDVQQVHNIVPMAEAPETPPEQQQAGPQRNTELVVPESPLSKQLKPKSKYNFFKYLISLLSMSSQWQYRGKYY